jgi:cyclohexyl-isocyanide hydratase
VTEGVRPAPGNGGVDERPDLLTVGFLAFPGVTALDLVGPHEILSRLPARTVIVGAVTGPTVAHRGPVLHADVSITDCPALDVLVVPGGPGQSQVCREAQTLTFVANRCASARLVMTVCTGALIVAAAGPLRGRRATTHWLARGELGRLGATPVADRLVWDGKFLSTAGVSAGLDGALILAARLWGADAAQRVQLAIEYDPAPPFTAGSPDPAPSHIVDALRSTSRFDP